MKELMKRLETIAWKKSKPFCYGCYKEAPTGRCATCLSDDLMRIVPKIGSEWGIEWVCNHLIEENLKPVNVDEAFEESVRSCYPETVHVGWMTLDTVEVMKEADPISWNIAKDEWSSFEADEGNLVTFDNGATYYGFHDVEQYIEETEAQLEAAS